MSHLSYDFVFRALHTKLVGIACEDSELLVKLHGKLYHSTNKLLGGRGSI